MCRRPPGDDRLMGRWNGPAGSPGGGFHAWRAGAGRDVCRRRHRRRSDVMAGSGGLTRVGRGHENLGRGRRRSRAGLRRADRLRGQGRAARIEEDRHRRSAEQERHGSGGNHAPRRNC
jgi:hypothetical protein